MGLSLDQLRSAAKLLGYKKDPFNNVFNPTPIREYWKKRYRTKTEELHILLVIGLEKPYAYIRDRRISEDCNADNTTKRMSRIKCLKNLAIIDKSLKNEINNMLEK